MIIDTAHPMLRDCRLLVLPQSASRCFNLMGIGPRATVAAGVEVSSGRGRRAWLFDDSGNNLITFAGQRNYLRPVKGLTAIVRCRVSAANSGASPTVSGILNCRAGALSTTNGGWGFFHVESGFINTGMNFGVYGPSNAFTAVRDSTTASYSASDHTYAGTWDAFTGRLIIHTDGAIKGGATAAAPTYAADVSTDIVLGGFGDADNRLNGLIDFAAVFDRVLSNQEIKRWNTPELPFLRAESVATQTGDTVDFGTVIQARSTMGVAGVAGVAVFANSVSARGALGGTITVVDTETSPTPGVVIARYTTGLGIAGPSNAGTPTLATYRNIVGVASGADNDDIVSYESEVGVSSRIRTRTDNRSELLAFSRYRR